jgi:hypothetical protein
MTIPAALAPVLTLSTRNAPALSGVTNLVCVEAELVRPRMKLPPVAEKAASLREMTRAVIERKVEGAGKRII